MGRTHTEFMTLTSYYVMLTHFFGFADLLVMFDVDNFLYLVAPLLSMSDRLASVTVSHAADEQPIGIFRVYYYELVCFI